ncbi:MAG: type II/IV secretion system ATPase subunit [Candidatus Methanomethylicia archaeon]|nr:type II/IV secretion system ATPase subunit [Candidatus Methanomethylicia archaeon]MCX8168995.1 type II/IV secretion system ATPase subunit [Candidatus Methanomethylicia archaeon]MDW7988726.1 type II/IV secretion system ATPase subunit [Nitrososphaerota archaeon]
MFLKKLSFRNRHNSEEPFNFKFFRAKLPINSSILASYKICNNQVHVIIAEYNGEGFYMISEPELMDIEIELYKKLSNILKFEIELPRDFHNIDLFKFVRESIYRIADDYGFKDLYELSLDRIAYYISRDLGYGYIEPLLRDPDIEDIKCVGACTSFLVWHRRFGYLDWLSTNIVLNEYELNSLAFKLSHICGKHISIAFPILDAILPDKHRLSICYGKEVSARSTNICIRKFREKPYTIMHLIYNFSTLSPLMACYFWLLIENKKNIFILGGTATGKTTFLCALSALFKPNWSVDSIEDVPELKIPVKGWEPLISRHSFSIDGKQFEVSLFDLVKVAIRKRPDYIVVGEVRGEEAYVLFQAAAIGHGCMCTMHADSLEAAIKRLSSPPMNVSPTYIPLMNCAVVLKKIDHNESVKRRIVNVYEIKSHDNYIEVFKWNSLHDTFIPSSVDSLVSSNFLLKQIAEERGWTTKDLIREINCRLSFFENLNTRGIFEYDDFVSNLRLFYYSKNSKVMEFVIER